MLSKNNISQHDRAVCGAIDNTRKQFFVECKHTSSLVEGSRFTFIAEEDMDLDCKADAKHPAITSIRQIRTPPALCLGLFSLLGQWIGLTLVCCHTAHISSTCKYWTVARDVTFQLQNPERQ